MATTKLGNTVVLVQDDLFEQEYQQGYERFNKDFLGIPLPDARIHGFIAQNIHDVLHLDRENAGYVVGWVAALLATNTATEAQLDTVIAVLER